MTYEETLEYAKGGLEIYQRDYPELITQIEFQKLVIKALEKQVPKKVIKYKRIGDVLIGGYCPACGAELHISNRPCYCGQVLNWGDEE